MARFGSSNKDVTPQAPTPTPEPTDTRMKREAKAQAKLEAMWDGIEEDARNEREAMAAWIRGGCKGDMPETPAVDAMMAARKSVAYWHR